MARMAFSEYQSVPTGANVDTAAEGEDPAVGASKSHLLQALGPGVITGASFDDPSFIRQA
jgi:hypothetical protein